MDPVAAIVMLHAALDRMDVAVIEGSHAEALDARDEATVVYEDLRGWAAMGGFGVPGMTEAFRRYQEALV